MGLADALYITIVVGDEKPSSQKVAQLADVHACAWE
jgi:hypothetical protein